ncbi:hypothetical protein Tco_0926521 [Tanacetum coccineum]|uniref:Reverse transcriptase domain-containing protein n=1 Tax=Tanacetum coccineum TaxID=301880 RepID=A0ABQ5DAV0_9ASTR
MEDDFKTNGSTQRRVNPKIHEVIKKEVIKLLDAGLIYPISDSPWVIPVHCVPKKGGMTVIENDNKCVGATRGERLVTDDAQDTKPIIAPVILLLQELDVIIHDKKGAENLAADHLSRLENPHEGDLEKTEINETFPLETLGIISSHNDSSTPYWGLSKGGPAGDHRKVQLNELNDLRDQAYENSLIYKEKIKKIHDLKIKNRVFNIGDRVLLFNSRLKIFSGKLRTSLDRAITNAQVSLCTVKFIFN